MHYSKCVFRAPPLGIRVDPKMKRHNFFVFSFSALQSGLSLTGVSLHFPASAPSGRRPKVCPFAEGALAGRLRGGRLRFAYSERIPRRSLRSRRGMRMLAWACGRRSAHAGHPARQARRTRRSHRRSAPAQRSPARPGHELLHFFSGYALFKMRFSRAPFINSRGPQNEAT